MARQFPDWKAPATAPFIVFGCFGLDQNGAGGSSVSPETGNSTRSGIDLQSGVDGVELNGVLGDGSVRKEEEGVVLASDDQVCSVSEIPVPPVAGESSGEGLVSSPVFAEEKNGGVEDVKSDYDDFHELVPFDFNGLSTEDAPANNGYSGESERMKKDINFNNIWSNQGPLSYDPFGNHSPNGKVDGFPMERIDEMMRGLSVQDLIASSNVLPPPPTFANPSVGLIGGHVMNDQYTYRQMPYYAPPPMMTDWSLGPSSSSSNVLGPSRLANSYNGLNGRPFVTDHYTDDFPFNRQAGSYTKPIRSMMNDLSLGSSSSFSNGFSGVETDYNSFKFDVSHKHVVELSMTRDGTRHLVDMMANGPRKTIVTILAAVASDVFTVMASEYGPELFRNLLTFCDHTQKEFLLDRIVSDPIGVILRAQTVYGSKSLMVLVENLKWSGLVHQIPSILASEIKPLLLDRYSNQLIQRCISVLKPNQCERLYEALTECACSLALDVHRCGLLYILLNNIKGIHRTRLLDTLANNSVQLAKHPSGNYVVKCVVELKDTGIARKISYLLRKHYKTLAMDKHGSHVVEACIQSAGINFVMDEILALLPEELQELACHEYGNYVIKKALEITEKYDSGYYGKLVGALLPGLARLKESQHGKSVYKLLKDENRCKNGGRGKKMFRC